jgi:hypothetical protein
LESGVWTAVWRRGLALTRVRGSARDLHHYVADASGAGASSASGGRPERPRARPLMVATRCATSAPHFERMPPPPPAEMSAAVMAPATPMTAATTPTVIGWLHRSPGARVIPRGPHPGHRDGVLATCGRASDGLPPGLGRGDDYGQRRRARNGGSLGQEDRDGCVCVSLPRSATSATRCRPKQSRR